MSSTKFLHSAAYILRIRSTASLVLSWLPNAVSRKYPSPDGPKPEPGVPMTPATAVGALSSAMTSISGVRVRLTSSRVVMVSPSAALRTMILPPLTYW